MKQQKFYFYIPYVILTLASIIMINNMFYSFCWSDEGFYLSTLNRMLTGDKLFIDDWSPTQSYSVLLLPFYSLFIRINNSTDGIYLYFRILTVLFQTVVAFFTYYILSRKNNKSLALTSALITLFFSRACLNGPSYYVLGCETYLLGILFIYSVFELNYKKIFLFFAGIFFGLSVLCNPYLVLPYIFLSIFVFIISFLRQKLLSFLIIWLGTLFTGFFYVLFAFKNIQLDEFLKSIYYIFNDPAYGKSTILFIKRLIKCPRLVLFPYIFTYLPVLISCIIIKVKKIELSIKLKYIFQFINIFFLLLNVFIKRDCGSAVMAFFHFTVYANLLFTKMNFKLLWHQYSKKIIYFIFPGLILAYFFCFASDTGYGVCTIGMVIVTIGSIFIFLDSFDIAFVKSTKFYKTLKTIPLVILVLGTLFYRVNLIYRDKYIAPHFIFIPQLHSNISKITEGPAKKLYTGDVHKKQYDNLLFDLRSIPYKTGDSLYISKLLPWGYVANYKMKCSSPTTWRLPFDDFRIQPYFEDFSNHKLPDFVLLIDEDIFDNDENETQNSWFNDILDCQYKKQKLSVSVLYTKIK